MKDTYPFLTQLDATAVRPTSEAFPAVPASSPGIQSRSSTIAGLPVDRVQKRAKREVVICLEERFRKPNELVENEALFLPGALPDWGPSRWT
jgi:hypothetical protein